MSAKGELPPIIIVKKKVAGHGHHGGAWKVAYADFVTAMMAFFMVMWLVVTQPQEVLGGIADYFKSPSAVDGQATKMVPGGMGPGGAGDKMVRIFDEATTKSGETDEGKKRDLTPEELRKKAAEAERKRLESLMEELKAAIEASQSLAPFKDQLLIDITPEGLRVQIVDRQNRPMFDSGSFRLQDYTAEILDELAEYLDKVPNRIALTGHTDVTPFGNGDTGYTNWELSADRANAARRALISGGLRDDKFARVVGLSSTTLFDKANPENPINRRISIILLNQAAEDQAREMDEYDIDGPPAAPGPAPSEASAAVAAPPASAPAAAPADGARPVLSNAREAARAAETAARQ
jgi:chemotaxis protein MotB